MPRKKSTFTQTELTRALKGATAAGLKVGSYEIRPDGAIRVYAADEVASPKTALESWKVKRDARSA